MGECYDLSPALGATMLLNVGLTRTRVPTATPEDDRGEKAEPRRYALLTLIRHGVGGEGAGGCGGGGGGGAEGAARTCFWRVSSYTRAASFQAKGSAPLRVADLSSCK